MREKGKSLGRLKKKESTSPRLTEKGKVRSRGKVSRGRAGLTKKPTDVRRYNTETSEKEDHDREKRGNLDGTKKDPSEKERVIDLVVHPITEGLFKEREKGRRRTIHLFKKN